MDKMAEKSIIWVVDDDSEIRKLLDEYLTKQDFSVRTYAGAADVEKWLLRMRPDLLVLDWMLRGMSGLELCHKLREQGDDIPVIMLTARGEPEDCIRGFEAGADDYLAKPFHPGELTMRIAAVLRRRQVKPVGTPVPDGESLYFGDCQLNLATRELHRNGRSIGITTGEFALLAALVTHPHQSLSRERLRELARGPASHSDERSIDVQISRLRKMIEPENSPPRHIQTVWGMGYVFVPDIKSS